MQERFQLLHIIEFDSLEEGIWPWNLEGLLFLPEGRVQVLGINHVEIGLQVGLDKVGAEILELFMDCEFLFQLNVFQRYRLVVLSAVGDCKDVGRMAVDGSVVVGFDDGLMMLGGDFAADEFVRLRHGVLV